MTTRKMLYKFSLGMLTIGASVIIGFLSFSGMFVLLPVIPVAFLAFFLSVGYDGEIYLQNIKNAVKKLSKTHFLERQFAKQFLCNPDNFPDLNAEGCPDFFKDYQRQLDLLAAFDQPDLSEDSCRRKRQIEKTIGDMEKWFGEQLFLQEKRKDDEQTTGTTRYKNAVRIWLNEREGQVKKAREQLDKRRLINHVAKGFSVLSAVFMGLGTTYLLVEAFAVIPFVSALPFTTLPFIIVPMAIIAGVSYGFLTYNAVTDMIHNRTLQRWYEKIRDSFKGGITVKNVFIASMAIFLVGLAIALTVCTAGTWWTVVKQTRPLFAWMERIPTFVMGIINPIVNIVSTIIFNLENTSGTMKLVDDALNKKHAHHPMAETPSPLSLTQRIKRRWDALREKENYLQLFNPFRILLKLTFTPLRIVLFLSHLVSIGVTGNRFPGIPEIISTLLGILSEGFEDAHYFIPHDHHDHHASETKKSDHFTPAQQAELRKKHLEEEHSHNHDDDLPTRVLRLLFTPLFYLAARVDYHASDDKNYTLEEAKRKMRGKGPESDIPKDKIGSPSDEWKLEHTIYQIDAFKEKQFQSNVMKPVLAKEKRTLLTTMQKKLVQLNAMNQENTKLDTASFKDITQLNGLNQADAKTISSARGLPFFSPEKTRTEKFLTEELLQRANVISSAA